MLASGCAEGTGTTVRDNAEVTYVVHVEAEVSDQEIDWAVQQVKELAALYGVEPPHFTYHYYGDSGIPAGGPCPVIENSVAPCFFEGSVYATTVANTHELVHVIQAQRPPTAAFLKEGTADLVGDGVIHHPEGDFDTVGAMFGRPNLAELLAIEWPDYVEEVGGARAYNTAASVARYFLDELGWEGLLAFEDALGQAQTDKERTTALETAMGKPVSEIEDDYEASNRYPSESHAWSVASLLRPIDQGQSLDFWDERLPSLSFEHDSSLRTILTIEGHALFQIERLEGGLIHPQTLQPFLDQVLKVALDGPSGSYVFRSIGGKGSLTVSRAALDAELELDPLIVLGTAGSHTPVCVAGTKQLTIYNVGLERSFEFGFISGRPARLDACRGTSCETIDLWDGKLIVSAAFDAPGCLMPSGDYPQINGTVNQGDFPAAPGSGRFVLYELGAE